MRIPLKKIFFFLVLIFLCIFCIIVGPHLVPVRIKQIRNVIKYDHGIPNILFRTYPNLSTSFSHDKYCHREWSRLNPGISVIWYSHKDRDTFMEKYYSGEILNAYNTLIPGAYKADLWRLCILYKFGGMYIDAYSMPFMPFSYILRDCYNTKGKHQFISAMDCEFSGGGIQNGFIVCTRKHPFLKQAIKDIVTNVRKRYYGESPLAPTGPLALSKSISTALGTKLPFKIGHNNFGKLSFYLLDYFGPTQRIYKDKFPVITKSYSYIHYTVRKLDSNTYPKMWKEKRIYTKSKSI